MASQTIKTGDWVIYCKTKFSPHPGTRARNVQPSPNGDEYNYTVDKFWVVTDVAQDGSITLQTRRGKRHVVAANDIHLRRPKLWERWWYRDKFQAAATGEPGTPSVREPVGSGLQRT
ncbi:MAG: hypothetical protein NT069_16310 [Planctomycetota bacterium]|nr:hypothetical protein [Planctomycetota bacterium]